MKILFLCVANSARSQMAEGLARSMLDASFSIESAGSKPAHVNPYAIEVMNELGINLGSHKSKSIAAIDLSDTNLIVTLCAEEVCPVVPAAVRRLHWPVQDPAGQGDNSQEELKHFRIARDQIKQHIESLRADLPPPIK